MKPDAVATGTPDTPRPRRRKITPDPRAQRAVVRMQLAAPRAAALLQGEGFMRLPEVLAVFPVSKGTWWEGVRTGRFPASVKLGPRCTAWRVSDIRALVDRLGTTPAPAKPTAGGSHGP